jgi:hypothetical protein
MSHPTSTHNGLERVADSPDTCPMTRLTLVGANGNRFARLVTIGSTNVGTTEPAGTLVPIGAAHRTAHPGRYSSPALSPDSDGPISSPAKHRRAFRNAQRSIGLVGNGETAIEDADSGLDDGPDGEAA